MNQSKKNLQVALLQKIQSLNPAKAKLVVSHLRLENSSTAECPVWRCSGHSKGGHADK